MVIVILVALSASYVHEEVRSYPNLHLLTYVLTDRQTTVLL
jgi:hypothetical protein